MIKNTILKIISYLLFLIFVIIILFLSTKIAINIRNSNYFQTEILNYYKLNSHDKFRNSIANLYNYKISKEPIYKYENDILDDFKISLKVYNALNKKNKPAFVIQIENLALKHNNNYFPLDGKNRDKIGVLNSAIRIKASFEFSDKNYQKIFDEKLQKDSGLIDPVKMIFFDEKNLNYKNKFPNNEIIAIKFSLHNPPSFLNYNKKNKNLLVLSKGNSTNFYDENKDSSTILKSDLNLSKDKYHTNYDKNKSYEENGFINYKIDFTGYNYPIYLFFFTSFSILLIIFYFTFFHKKLKTFIKNENRKERKLKRLNQDIKNKNNNKEEIFTPEFSDLENKTQYENPLKENDEKNKSE